MSSYAIFAAAAAPTDPHNFTGIVGFGVSLMYGIGEWRGAERMNFWRFSLLTAAGSAIWNALLIGDGVLLGTQYDLVEQYCNLLNYAVYAAIAGVVVSLVIRQFRRSAAKRRLAAGDAE